jgi:DNA polymerase I-like protein with 3'-5' exonuclease and polymerase domains
MSNIAPETPLADDIGAQLLALRRLLAEAQALGARFRLCGADVAMDGADGLPEKLRAALHSHADSGLLWSYLGGDADEDGALDLLDLLNVEAVLVETRNQGRAAVRQLLRDLQQHGPPLGLDIETALRPGYRADSLWVRLNKDGGRAIMQPVSNDRSALSPHTATIATMQLHAGGHAAFVFRAEALDLVLHSHWLRRQWIAVHNATFEAAFLRHHARGYRKPRDRRIRFRLDCTMQAAGLLLGVQHGGGRSLAAASTSFLGVDVPKELRSSDWSAPRLSPGQLAYAAADAVLTKQLWPLLADELQAKDRGNAYELQRGAVAAVADMELRGLTLDTAAHAEEVDAWSRELAEARRRYYKATSESPPSTPNEVRGWLSAVLDNDALACWPRTESGLLSIEGRHLKRLTSIASARPVLSILAHEKLLANFGPKLGAMRNPATGRLHAHYNIAGSKSGRFTCNNPNLQQLPSARAPEFRRCIVAAPGKLLVGCDWNQIEMRAAAWISGDAVLTVVYEEERDLHRENAALIAGVPLEDVTPAMRQAAKPVSFGSIYGIGPRSLAEDAFASYGVEITEAEAKRSLDAFFQRFATLAGWRQEHYERCQSLGYVRIGAGRVVEAAWEPEGRLSFPQCCNLPVQGICADAMLRALTLVHRRFIAAGIRGGLVASVHDELLVEVVEADAEVARDLLQRAMLDAFAETFPGAPTAGVASARSGRTWGDLRG